MKRPESSRMRRTRRLRTWAVGVLLMGIVAAPGMAEDELSPSERAKRIAEARKQADAEERAFVERVNAAIDRGRDHLLSRIGPKGDVPAHYADNNPMQAGHHALAMYTLLKCGVKPKHKTMKKVKAAMDEWLRRIGQPGWQMPTYAAAIVILAYEALHRPLPKPTRPGRKPKPVKLPKLSRETRAIMTTWVEWLIQKQEAHLWRYPGARGDPQVEDLSHGQYVLLALHTAAERGLKVPEAVWRKALGYLLAQQDKTGPEVRLLVENPAWEPGVEDRYGRFLPGPKARARGWSYLPDSPLNKTGSMTTAGVAALAIIKGQLRAKDALGREDRDAIDTALRDGLAWLQENFTVQDNPGFAGGWHYYYLYGLERAGVLTGRRFLGAHDWYREGATLLMDQQEKNGGWLPSALDPNAGHQDEITQTCFALLFLKRATVPPPAPLGPPVTGD